VETDGRAGAVGRNRQAVHGGVQPAIQTEEERLGGTPGDSLGHGNRLTAEQIHVPAFILYPKITPELLEPEVERALRSLGYAR
jgi:hypothetical protein